MKIKAKFAASTGNVLTATFDQADGSVVSDDGRKGKYVREGNTLKIEGDQSMVITFKDTPPTPPPAGFTTSYTTSIGTSGTVTILSVG
jgi:hypothetical protein